MKLNEMTQNLRDLVDNPDKAATIIQVILESGNKDLIQRALELYVLLILHHSDEIQEALNKQHDEQQSYKQIIDRLERELNKQRKVDDRGVYWDKIMKERWDMTKEENYKEYLFFERQEDE